MDIRKASLNKHREWKGKIEVAARICLETQEDLSLAYTPGVAEACLEIQKDIGLSYELTRRGNMVAVITDGTAVLGLGDIGPEASMPVMEGKCALFKAFADVDAIPLCIRSKDTEEFIRTVSLLSGSFGGINLEDIAAPRCFDIEKRLQTLCDIPVFHDDQHGTAVVVAAALINALKYVGKSLSAVRIVINGAGAAGIAVAKHLTDIGVTDITLADRFGLLSKNAAGMNPIQTEVAQWTNPNQINGVLHDALQQADVFIGLSSANALCADLISVMAKDPIIFALANPIPEIMPEEAIKAGAVIVGTGRSDFCNQINNVLAFPGIFRGALDCRAKNISSSMMQAASYAISGLVTVNELRPDYILPGVLDKRVSRSVAEAVIQAAFLSDAAR